MVNGRLVSPILSASLLFYQGQRTLADVTYLKPSDFQPLTTLPWKENGATLESVISRIYLDPNEIVRKAVLEAYLQTIPASELGKAFDLCVVREETQTPDELVGVLLEIWGRRDPAACWQKTRQLFHVVGIEDGWLSYSSWDASSSAITVQDRVAIEKSPFWLNSQTLTCFPFGVDESKLPRAERLKYLRLFANEWFEQLGTWPGGWTSYRADVPSALIDIAPVFEKPVDQLGYYFLNWPNSANDRASLEVATRRWIEASPEWGPQIAQRISKIAGQKPGERWSPSQEFYMIWARKDMAGLVRWADTMDAATDDIRLDAKSFLMSRVDDSTQNRWLAEERAKGRDNDLSENLYEGFVQWVPEAGMESVLKSGNLEEIEEAPRDAAYGPWGGRPYNTCRYGLEYIKGFDPMRMPETYRKQHYDNWEEIMEVWGDIDIGESARYAYNFLFAADWAPRKDLLAYFGGGKNDDFSSGTMASRALCALRVWAVVRPKEMKDWIATLKGADERKTLTWLLEHPQRYSAHGQDVH